MAYQQVDIFIKDNTPLQQPVPNVVVNAYSANGSQLFTQSTTDADGHVGFLLDEETYQFRFFKFGVGFANPKYIEVLATPNVFDIVATLLPPPVSNDLRLCVAYGFFRDATGAPAPNTDIHFITKFRPLLLDGSAVLNERVSAHTDKNGYAQVNLIRCGKYDVTIEGLEDYTRCIAVPDAPNVSLPDLLFPVVQAVTFDPTVPLTMTVGGPDLQITPTGITSDGNTLTPPQTCEAVQFSSSDPNVLGLLIAGGILTLRPLSAGTAELRGVRNDKSIVRIPDAGLIGLPISVVIS